METLLEMYRRGDWEGIWTRYCGHLELGMEEFLDTQRRLLSDQLQAWQRSLLARKVFGGVIPTTVEEFRQRTPITTYEDYADVLLNKREEELAEKAFVWVHTSGRGGQYEFKWFPFTRGMYDAMSDYSVGCFILAPCRKRGEIRIKERDRLMFTLAPVPFVSGLVVRSLYEQFNFRIWPPYEQAVKMEFSERIREAIRLAFSEGIDYFYGISSFMIALSEQFEEAGKGGGSPDMRRMLRDPKILFRLVRGMVKSKLRGGPLRPSDLWRPRGIICGGMDTSVYRERIRAMWGEYPREGYGCSEFGFIANQHYAGVGMVPNVKTCYLEFLEMDEHAKWKQDRSYRPRLLLLSEVEVGRDYALVGTNFFGGVLVRYLLGDSVRFLSLRDPQIGLQLPQLMVSSRIDDVIDIAGFTRLTEKTVWSAVEGSGVRYVDWVVAKEFKNDQPVLHLYLEPRADDQDAEQARRLIHEELKRLDPQYRDLEEMAGIRPLAVTLFSRGTFQRYQKERQAAGYDIAHLKPPHMNPRPEVVSRLVAMSAIRI
jgi:hypothetical protein